MSTNNFENAKNGIFVIEEYEPMSYEQWLEYMGYNLNEGKNNQQLESDYEDYLEDNDGMDMALDDTISNITNDLEAKGYEITEVTPYNYKVVGKSIDGQIGLLIQSGYYSNAQVIVTTQRDEQLYHLNEVLQNGLWYDDDYVEVLDDMLPDDEVVINVVSQYTTPIKKVGSFNNGEAVYDFL